LQIRVTKRYFCGNVNPAKVSSERFLCQRSSVVEQRTHNSKTAILAIFSSFLLPSAIIAKQLILLAIFNV
jgi:hypothetical protein